MAPTSRARGVQLGRLLVARRLGASSGPSRFADALGVQPEALAESLRKGSAPPLGALQAHGDGPVLHRVVDLASPERQVHVGMHRSRRPPTSDNAVEHPKTLQADAAHMRMRAEVQPAGRHPTGRHAGGTPTACGPCGCTSSRPSGRRAAAGRAASGRHATRPDEEHSQCMWTSSFLVTCAFALPIDRARFCSIHLIMRTNSGRYRIPCTTNSIQQIPLYHFAYERDLRVSLFTLAAFFGGRQSHDTLARRLQWPASLDEYPSNAQRLPDPALFCRRMPVRVSGLVRGILHRGRPGGASRSTGDLGKTDSAAGRWPMRARSEPPCTLPKQHTGNPTLWVAGSESTGVASRPPPRGRHSLVLL